MSCLQTKRLPCVRTDLTIRGPVDDQQAAALCRRAHERLDAGAKQLVVTTTGRVDLSVVEALARLRLLTRRRGATLRVAPSPDSPTDGDAAELSVQSLLDFAGLDGVVDPWESC
jgi:hypothetical protein